MLQSMSGRKKSPQRPQFFIVSTEIVAVGLQFSVSVMSIRSQFMFHVHFNNISLKTHLQ